MSREKLSRHQLKLMRSLSAGKYQRPPPGTRGITIVALVGRGYIKLQLPSYGRWERWSECSATLTPDGVWALERVEKQERIDANS